MLARVAFAMGFVALFAGDALAQRARCRYSPTFLRYCDGCVVDRRIVAPAGAVCPFYSRTSGALLGHDVVTRPQLGVFGMASEYQAAYRAGSTPGRDYFEYRVRWERFGRTNTVTIRNHVTVR